MNEHAKLFRNGGSQAVRLPKSCRFEDQTEVLARRDGVRVILEPADTWSLDFIATLGAWEEAIERPNQIPLSELRDPFEQSPE